VTGGRWVRVTSIESVPPREGRPVTLGERELAIFNLGDRFVATDNRCPHDGGPLCDGIVTGSSVVCPLHSWKINLGSGCIERPTRVGEVGVATYPTRVEGGVVLVELPRAKWGRGSFFEGVLEK
jgi:nitrite reductase (NADH) small subunit